MEDNAQYRAQPDLVYVRGETLLPYAAWVPPNADEVRTVMRRAGVEPRELAELVGVSRKEVNRWTTGNGEILFACWVLLCRRAGVGYEDF